jgi:hypothetical protein
MNYETYFPDQRHLLALTTFRRDRLLPMEAIGGVEVVRGERVDLRTVIARGAVPAPYTLIEAAKILRLRKLEDLDDLLHVRMGDPVEIDQLLAGKPRGRRGIRSPITGMVVFIGAGRIILQQAAESTTVEAGLNGQVVDLRRGRGAVIEGIGAVVQGVWGNDRRTIGTLRLEPDEGMEHIYSDTLESPYRGSIVVTRRPLRAASLGVMVDQGLVGVIAPSFELDLLDAVMSVPQAILLTEGFGSMRMGGAMFSFLSTFPGRQATLDCMRPGVLEARRPEAIITVPVNPGERPPPVRNDLTLQVETQVRLTRGNFAGNIGRVIGLAKNPVMLENGLRVYCAQVELVTGEKLAVPLENLEVFG